MSTTVTATEAKSSLGRYLAESQREPIIIEKMGRPFAVLVSQTEYHSLQTAATRRTINGNAATNSMVFAATESSKFDDEVEWVKAKNGFDRIALLKDNWDHSGSPPPATDAISFAWKMVTSLYCSACRRGEIGRAHV